MSPLEQILATANRPAPAPTPAQIAPTNVAGIDNNYNQAKMDEYKAQIAQQNGMFGGLAALGGAGISALPKLLGGAGAGTAALGAGSAIPGAVGATSVGGAPLVAAASGGIGDTLASLLPFLALA